MSRRAAEQLRAGHRPSELVPDGVHPVAVTVVLPAPRSYAGPVALVAAGSAGVCAALHLATELAYALVPFAGLSVGGVTLAIRSTRRH